MSHDSRGAPLHKGDRVFVEMELTEEPTADGGYCNASCRAIVPDQKDPPPMSPPGCVFNTRMLTKIGAALLGAAVIIALACGSVMASGQEKPAILADKSEVDRHEILRRGAAVVVAGEGPRDSADLLFSMAMAPPDASASVPADDSDQWHITLFGPSKDEATLALHKAFERDPSLACFVASPGDGHRPWAHYMWLRSDDATQRWRFDEFNISAAGPFPIVTMQPPRDGSWGGLTTIKDRQGKDAVRAIVVDRIDGERDPRTIGRRLSASVRLWTRKLAEHNFVPPQKVVARYSDGEQLAHRGPQAAEESGSESSASHGQQPPFQVPPPNVPFNPIFPPGGPAADPTPAPTGALVKLILTLFPSAQTILLFLTALSNVWLLYRDFAQKAGIKLVVDEATYQKLKDLLAKLTGTTASGPASEPKG